MIGVYSAANNPVYPVNPVQKGCAVIPMDLKYAIFAAASTLLIIYVSSIPQQSFSGTGSLSEQIISNLLHIPAFAVLTFFWLKSFRRERYEKRYLLSNSLILLGVFLFAISDEIHQSFVPGRTASLMDIGLNVLGILLGLGAFAVLKRIGVFQRKRS